MTREKERMGHSIVAWISKQEGEKRTTPALEQMERTAGDPSRAAIYKLLCVEKFNNGVSGSGDGKVFWKGNLEAAFSNWNQHENQRSLLREGRFIMGLLEWMDLTSSDKVYIYFD
jgi:hypothetical protein